MSKLMYAYLRDRSDDALKTLKQRVLTGAARISPGGEHIRPTRLSTDGQVVVAVLNPSSSVLVNASSVCLGHLVEEDQWNSIGSDSPDGTYAICRANSDKVELLSDAVASRTLWYYLDSKILLACTSQRWMITVLGSFEPNPAASTWMLTSGTLGPTDGWDKRLTRLQADSVLTLDIQGWTASLRSREVKFTTDVVSAPDKVLAFRDVLSHVFESLKFDYTKWVLPLSGGYDSRAILCMLGRNEELRTITWGVQASMSDSGSDAAIAKRLAKAVGVAHQYFETDPVHGTLSEVFEKFVEIGEGRTDHVTGYLDGFAVWRNLMSRGIEGVIRGDEGFGWKLVTSSNQARLSVGLRLWSDFDGLLPAGEFDLAPQVLPDFLLKQWEESPSAWRDRLYHQHRIPTLLAALTDLKAPFVEVANPLLSHSIIRSVRTLSDSLRTEKQLFKTIVDEASPSIPYADAKSIANQKDVLRTVESAQFLSNVLVSDAAHHVFAPNLLHYISENMRCESHRKGRVVPTGVTRWLRKAIPRKVKRAIKEAVPKPKADFHSMAFRVFVTSKSHELLRADANAERHADSA